MASIYGMGQNAGEKVGESLLEGVHGRFVDQSAYVEGIAGRVKLADFQILGEKNPVVKIVFSTSEGEISRLIPPDGLLVALQNYFQSCIQIRTKSTPLDDNKGEQSL